MESKLGLVGSVTIIIGLFAVGLLEASDVSALNNLSIITTAIIARFILGEKLSIAHLISTILSITGVVFILRPSFLFEKEFIDLSLDKVNNSISLNNSSNIANIEPKDSTSILVGVILVLICAFLAGGTNVIVKKLCSIKVN